MGMFRSTVPLHTSCWGGLLMSCIWTWRSRILAYMNRCIEHYVLMQQGSSMCIWIWLLMSTSLWRGASLLPVNSCGCIFFIAALGEGKDNFVQCPLEALRWEERKCLILEEILAYQPDILCLQEVDHYFDTFQPLLSRMGYQCTFFPKPWSPCLDVECNNGPDGCALFFLKDRFTLVDSTNIRLTAMKLKTNQVAIAQTLKCNETGNLFCIAVTHLKARNGWERFRFSQGADLLENLKIITQEAKIPLIVCGDFNAEPTEMVYKEFSNSSLNLNSAYKVLSADGLSEPPYTTWKIRPSGECRHTLDYIWYSQHAFKVNAALSLLTEEQIGPNRLPSFNYPSDHLSLVCDFSFNEEPDRLL